MFIEFKDLATRSENSNEIVSMTPYLRQTITTIELVNDFVPGGRAEVFHLVAFSRLFSWL